MIVAVVEQAATTATAAAADEIDKEFRIDNTILVLKPHLVIIYNRLT